MLPIGAIAARQKKSPIAGVGKILGQSYCSTGALRLGLTPSAAISTTAAGNVEHIAFRLPHFRHQV
jgi:hypothetical protein